MHTVANISRVKEADLFSGTYIIVHNILRIPPHILISLHGRVYSTTVHGARRDEDLPLLFRSYRAKSTPVLFCRIKERDRGYAKNIIEESMSLYPGVVAGGATCLSPLIHFFTKVYGLDLGGVNFIFELLPVLEKKGLVEGYTELHFNKDRFTFSTYSKADIDLEISKALRNPVSENR